MEDNGEAYQRFMGKVNISFEFFGIQQNNYTTLWMDFYDTYPVPVDTPANLYAYRLWLANMCKPPRVTPWPTPPMPWD